MMAADSRRLFTFFGCFGSVAEWYTVHPVDLLLPVTIHLTPKNLDHFGFSVRYIMGNGARKWRRTVTISNWNPTNQ